MLKTLALLLMLAPLALAAQQTHTLTVKDTPAEQSLLSLAKQSQSTFASYNALRDQANKELAAKNQPILDEIKAKSAKWQAKIDADTKDLRAQVDANNKAALDAFNEKIKPLMSQMVPQQTITTLVELVKKEQGLPADATFDVQTGQWSEPKK